MKKKEKGLEDDIDDDSKSKDLSIREVNSAKYEKQNEKIVKKTKTKKRRKRKKKKNDEDGLDFDDSVLFLEDDADDKVRVDKTNEGIDDSFEDIFGAGVTMIKPKERLKNQARSLKKILADEDAKLGSDESGTSSDEDEFNEVDKLTGEQLKEGLGYMLDPKKISLEQSEETAVQSEDRSNIHAPQEEDFSD
mmetsp:Transcript_32699/g.28963  ORF Transcript_32699/g.28963 Transcript_32699/m.28963 type:complete len:192 (-) Transcript_32699:74-649(-)|eukprot:CAMPEP_0205804786 /NCGR_PEP_ID=MMETSP0205-20121125/7811_1 /ASSEMBLY_ACC=CAM_ASM_000278 /TAXON_ID=36767 /ORGANISM="Euplotes focardii, Strain TN1" /LENGTH=191 /DNA_ID=CAMNT_0053074955 /DNA_START=349 /DNA_END=924 /DNA_ORIENTATION=-